MRKLYIHLLLIAAIGLFVFTPSLANAQDTAPVKTSTTDGLTITPLRTNPTIKAGEKTVQKITVQNRTAEVMTVTLSYEEFSLANESYDYTFSEPKHTLITFETNQFNLSAGEKKSVPYQIDVPANYPPGGYYFTLFASNSSEKGSVQTQSRVGSLVFLTVDGTLDRATVIREIDIPSFSIKTTIPVSLLLQNSGNVHSENTITSTFSGPRTNIQTTSLNLVMPGTTRRISYELAAPRLPGIYSVRVSVNNGYNQPSATTAQVVYIPLWFIMLFVGLVIAVPTVLHKKRQAKHTKKTDQNVSGTAV